MDTIFIVEDDQANLQGISGVLRHERYSVLEASDGWQAIEKAKRLGPISLFVIDIDLPGASGTEIALKLLKLHPSLPVLFISGNPWIQWTRRDLSNFKQLPPNSIDFIEKPFSMSELIIRVRNMIGLTRIIKSPWLALWGSFSNPV